MGGNDRFRHCQLRRAGKLGCGKVKTVRNISLKLPILACAAGVFLGVPAHAAPVLFAGNGHYYEFVNRSVSFDDALTAAAASSYNSWQGYLVTITSDAERDFIYTNVTTGGFWAAGTDRDVEGTWKWAAGPENGTSFWKDGSTLTYASWSGSEPNNAGNEDYLWANWSGGNWNDIGATSLTFVVEYSGRSGPSVPEPQSWALMIAGFGLLGAALRRRAVLTHFA
jgi:hypothetical protein